MTMSLIQQFLSEKTIFVTGFPGFLGKLVVTKLLTSCPDIKKIYILIKQEPHPHLDDRVAEILQSKVFEKLREKTPEFSQKLIPIEGDVTLLDLGLKDEDKTALISETSVVYNLAQVSKCDSHLREAVEVNVHGTRNVFDLCKQMSNLVSVIHLSTVYSNCNHPKIAEMIYQPALHPQKLLNASEWVTDEVFNDIETFLMKGHANSYTYTKALAEYMIQQDYSALPVSIMRPAIIGSTWREPFPDWIDTPNGATPVIMASGRGQLRVMKGNPKSTAELIPADTVVNAIIAASWYQTVMKSERKAENPVQVYNLTSNAGRRLTWQTFEQVVCSSFRKNPLERVLRIPKASMTKNQLIYTVKGTLLHVFPAYIADLINLLLGRSPHYVNSNQKFMQLLAAAQYFTCRDWLIENTNLRELMSKLSSADKKIYGLDTSCTHWPSYIEGMCLGVKQYVAKEPLSGLPTARKAINRIRWADRFWMVVVFLIFIRLASTRVQWARKLWSVILAVSVYIYSKLPKFTKS